MAQSAAAATSEESKPIHFNLMMIGDQSVGKTSIMKRYVNKKFDANKIATTGVDFSTVRYKSIP